MKIINDNLYHSNEKQTEELVEQWIKKLITDSEFCFSSMDRLNQIGLEHFDSGGKRLRVFLAMSVGKAFGVKLECLIPWAAACEILHNATLVHDDIQDGDRVRRGKPTVWVSHGIPEAINLGDLLFMLPFKSIDGILVSDSIKWILSKHLSAQTENIIRGQSLEFSMLKELSRLVKSQSLSSYYQACVKKKTSALFELPVFGSALLGACSEFEALNLSKVFEDLGLMFQIQDDLLDLWGDKGRGEIGSDIKEGKVSALVVEHLSYYPSDLNWIKGILEQPREGTNQDMVTEVITRFEQSGTKERAIESLYVLKDQIFNNHYLNQNPSIVKITERLTHRLLDPIAHLFYKVKE